MTNVLKKTLFNSKHGDSPLFTAPDGVVALAPLQTLSYRLDKIIE